MSIARHHAEWLSLVPATGPFLSLPVLMETFNTGLEPHDPEHVRLLRQEFAVWQESVEKRKADPALHHHWIQFVLTMTLDLDERFLAEGQAIPQTLHVEIPEYHELLRPNIVIVDPGTRKNLLLVQTYLPSQDLSSYVVGLPWKASPDTRMTELLHATGIQLGLVTNGEHWMLVNAPKGETTGYASWYASLWLEEPITLRAFRSLLSAGRFFNVPDDQTLEALLKKSASNQQEVTDQLGYQVRKAVEVLIHEIAKIEHEPDIDASLKKLIAGTSETVLYESAITVMMRLVFLFCAEERGLIPSKPFPVYEENYSVSTISKQLRELAYQHGEELLGLRYDAWPRLLAAFRAVYGGLTHDEVHIPPYGGNLFNPDRFPFLEGRQWKTSWRDAEASPLPVNNRTVLHLLEALQLLQVKVPGGGPAEARRLSFRALDIEQIGHVYEGLLDHTAKRAFESFLGLTGTRDKEPEIPLAKLEKLLAKGEADLAKFLKEETGRSESAIKKSLKAELDLQGVARFRTACRGDDALWLRVQPFAGLVRPDNFGYPLVIPEGTVFVTAGADRRSSGTHYTPRSLTEPIVQYTMEPLVYVGPAEGSPKNEWKLESAKNLLDLKICDLACGSGAFLVQATRYMAERLLEAWDEARKADPTTPGITPEGTPSSGKANESLVPDDPNERKTYAMRIIAQRCLYGVDKNHLAVEMAKLSIWLLTLAKDKPFEFLDHSIRCGDSLVGIHSIEQLRQFTLKPGELAVKEPLISMEPFLPVVDKAIALRLKLEDLPANTVEDVQQQEELLEKANKEISQLRCAADLLVAAEFWGESAKDKLERVRQAATKSGYYIEQGSIEEFEQVAAKECRGQRLFHWPLEFPEVLVMRGGFDAFLCNPPFRGGTRISIEHGREYIDWVSMTFTHGGKRTDLVAYFFQQAFSLLGDSGFAGMLASNTISETDTRRASLDEIIKRGGTLFRVRPDAKWAGNASVTVNVVHFSHSIWNGVCIYGQEEVTSISQNLIAEDIALVAEPKQLSDPFGYCGMGSKPYGKGFLLTVSEANALNSLGDHYRQVTCLYLGGEDIVTEPEGHPSRYIINFGELPLTSCQQWPEALEIVKERVRPGRLVDKNKLRREKWWQFERHAKEVYRSIVGLERCLVTPETAKYLVFTWEDARIVFASTCNVVATDDPMVFSVLQSSIHEIWARRPGLSKLRQDPRYNPQYCYRTFPRPQRVSDDLRIVAELYFSARSTASRQRKEGFTTIYNRFHDIAENSGDIRKLRELHVEMDHAVVASYDWTDLDLDHGFHESMQGIRFTVSESARREVLQRLSKLNHERYAEEIEQGLHSKNGSAKKSPPKTKNAGKSNPKGATLFDIGEE
jgi:Eco57I restriction-modification methylase/restriction-modification enzyme MmeI-like protein